MVPPPWNYCFMCATCCYDYPDRHDFKKQSYVESYIPVCCCCNVCGRVQLAQELGIKAFDFKRVKEGAAASGETFKSDVMMRNL